MERLLGSVVQLQAALDHSSGSAVPLTVLGGRGGRAEDSSADAFWANLHESALFANDFLLGLGSSNKSQKTSSDMGSTSRGGGSTTGVLQKQMHREMVETSSHRLDSLHDGETGVSSFALSGIVEDDRDHADEQLLVLQQQARKPPAAAAAAAEKENTEEGNDSSGLIASKLNEERGAAEEENEEVRVEVDHILADLLAMSSTAGQSSFSVLLEKRVQLLRRIYEACARQRQRLIQHQQRIPHRSHPSQVGSPPSFILQA